MRRGIAIVLGGCTIITLAPISSGAFNRCYAAETGNAAENVQLDPGLIREVQFMLLRLGLDPGPIDGVAGHQTNRAVHKFQLQAGLPVADLPNEGAISTEFLTRLRDQAARAIFSNKRETEAPSASAVPGPPSSTKAPSAALVPAPVQPAPDRFSACPYNPSDFRIGDTQYTPDKFLRVGFGGSTAQAVSSLKTRLDEARQIAESIGGPALAEVQRQARVLNYFDCRLKIEQAAADKK